MTMYPSAAECPIAFNVPTGGLIPGSNWDIKTIQYVCTFQSLKKVTVREADNVHDYALRSIRSYVKDSQLPKLTELRERVWSGDNLGEIVGDRTLPIVFSYLPMVDERFVAFVQSTVLKRFPQWRVLHTEDIDVPALSLAIYPDAISIADGVFSSPFDDHLARWRDAITLHRETRDGPLRRQLSAVQRILDNTNWTSWRHTAPAVLLACDDYEGDRSYCSAWLLVPGSSPYDYEIDCPDLMEGNYYSVLADGSLGEYMSDKSPTRLWVRQVLVPRSGERVLHISNGNEAYDSVISYCLSDTEL